MLIYNLMEKFIDHFFPYEHNQMTKITPVKINCIEQNSSKVSRGGKHSASKSSSSMTSAGNHYVQVENEDTAAT